MLSLRIALRYLLSRKSHGAVNVISAVSMAGVAVTAAAMIVVLSVFNGFTQLVEKKTSSFNPPLLVVPAEGKTISDADSLAAALQTLPEVSVASPVIDEQAFAVAPTGQMPVHIRALAPAAMEASGLHRILVDGALDTAGATISVGVAMQLNLRPAGTAFPERGDMHLRFRDIRACAHRACQSRQPLGGFLGRLATRDRCLPG